MPKVIAFYLPQFHPTADNDSFWGPGFTEWTNVAAARALFPGHEQPHLPADLGFYDLRLEQTRLDQAAMAREAGVHGFAYWHYWFAGKRVLERPFDEVLRSQKPDFPFSLAWANESWTGIWHGSPGRVLLEQTYPGREDQDRHFEFFLSAFKDSRYIKINGKPLLTIYKPKQIPDGKEYLNYWRNKAQLAGFPDLFILGVNHNDFTDPKELGLDGAILSSLGFISKNRAVNFVSNKFWGLRRRLPTGSLRILQYPDIVDYLLPPELEKPENYPCILPNWDNTPRSKERGLVVQGSTPELFEQHVRKAAAIARSKPNHEIIFLKSWNEWAEGNYLEPDRKFGHQYLNALKNGLGI